MRNMIRKSARWYMPILLPVFIILALAIPVLAAYNYVIPIQVTNNSTTAYTNLPLLVPIYNDQLVTEDFMLATGLDVEVQESSSVPYSVVDDKLGIFTTGLAASQSKSFHDYLGFTPNATSYPLITGVGGYITIPDDATLELGDDFSVEFDGFLQVPSSGYSAPVYKQGAFGISVDSSGDLTAGVIDNEMWPVAAELVQATTATDTAIIQLDDDKFVAIYEIAANIYARVGEVSGTTITWGALSAAMGRYSGNVLAHSCCAIDTDTFVIMVKNGADADGYVTVGTVDGANAVTWADTDEFANKDVDWISCCQLDTDKWMMIYEDVVDVSMQVMLCSWSGAATTLGAETEIEANDANADSTCSMLDTDKAIVLYEEADINAYVITAAALVPTVGVKTVVSTSDAEGRIFVNTIDENTAVYYWDESWDKLAEVLTITGTTVTGNTEYRLLDDISEHGTLPSIYLNGYLVYGIIDNDAPDDLEVYRSKVDGTVIEVLASSTSKMYDGADILNIYPGLAILNSAEGKIIGCYSDFTADDDYVRIGYLNYVGYNPEVTVAGITSDEYDIEVTADGVNMKLYVDTVEEDSVALAGSSVPGNANDYIVGGNDSLPYINSLIIEVGAVQQLWYQPVTIIANTAIDRSGIGNHGDITWGTNPAGIEITVSAAISATDYTAGTDGATIPDPLPIPSSFNQTATNTTGITSLWLYDLVNRAADHLGFSAQTMYVIIGLITATGVGFGALIGTGNMLGFAIGFGATGGLFAASGVMPWWAITITVAIVAMGIYTWRRG